MDWAKTWEVVLPVVLALVTAFLLPLLKQQIGQVKDERLRAFLLEVVAAVERMIPRTPEQPKVENAEKLDLARKIVMQETGKTVPDYKIAAAVTALKGAAKPATGGN